MVICLTTFIYQMCFAFKLGHNEAACIAVCLVAIPKLESFFMNNLVLNGRSTSSVWHCYLVANNLSLGPWSDSIGFDA